MKGKSRRSAWFRKALAVWLALSLLLAAAGPKAAPALAGEPPPAGPPVVFAARTDGGWQPIPALFGPHPVPIVAEALTPEPAIETILSGITVSDVVATNARLSGEQPILTGGESYLSQTRYSYADLPMQKITQYAYEQFDRLGLETRYYTYTLSTGMLRRNVIAEQPGEGDPSKIYLITAHLDSKSEDPYLLAPGADDNASGSTAVLLAAEGLSRFRFNYTLRYVLFTGEEQGLVGSIAYAEALAARGEDVAGVLNLDMIGYNSDDSPIIDLHTPAEDPASLALAETFRDVITAYNLDLAPEILVGDYLGLYSDNASFWMQGYPAILAIEDRDDTTPYYHTTGDRLSSLDPAHFTEFVKAGAGSLAHLGNLVETGSLQGQVSSAEDLEPVSGALVQAVPQSGTVISTTSSVAGSYALLLPAGSYTLTVTADGYQPDNQPDVSILKGSRNQQDFFLFGPGPCTPLQGLTLDVQPAEPYVDQAVTFNAALEIGDAPVVYSWDFGDLSEPVTTTTGEASHRFPALAADADYSVQVEAENACTTLAAEQTITVRAYKSFYPFLPGMRP